jgi:YHS domain-containing protein
MAIVTDPVCGMRIDPEDAVASADRDGTTYSFCSQACYVAFVANAATLDPEAERLDEGDLAARAGTGAEQIRHLAALGILRPEDGAYPRGDVMRARVLLELERKGMDARAVGTAAASGHLTLAYLESAGRRLPRSDRTFAQLSEEVGISLETTFQSKSGRPMKIANSGKLIKEVLA